MSAFKKPAAPPATKPATTPGLFSGIKEAQNFKGSRRLEVGQYVCQVDTIRTFRSRKDNKQCFTAELTVVESSNDNFKPGDAVGWVAKENNFICYFLADVKSFLAAAGDCDEDEIDEDGADLAVSDEQPLRGSTVRVYVEPNQDPDKKFPIIRFCAHK